MHLHLQNLHHSLLTTPMQKTPHPYYQQSRSSHTPTFTHTIENQRIQPTTAHNPHLQQHHSTYASRLSKQVLSNQSHSPCLHHHTLFVSYRRSYRATYTVKPTYPSPSADKNSRRAHQALCTRRNTPCRAILHHRVKGRLNGPSRVMISDWYLV